MFCQNSRLSIFPTKMFYNIDSKNGQNFEKSANSYEQMNSDGWNRICDLLIKWQPLLPLDHWSGSVVATKVVAPKNDQEFFLGYLETFFWQTQSSLMMVHPEKSTSK